MLRLVSIFVVFPKVFGKAVPNAEVANTVELSLSAPARPFPKVSGAIRRAENSRDSNESALFKHLAKAQRDIATHARGRILAAIAHSSFLKNPIDPSFRARVVPASADEDSAASEITALENSITSAENSLVSAGIAELRDLADVFVSHLEKSLRSTGRGAFLQKAVPGAAEGFSRQLNLRILSDENFPTISKLARDSVRRGEISMEELRSEIFAAEVNLAKDMLMWTQSALFAH